MSKIIIQPINLSAEVNPETGSFILALDTDFALKLKDDAGTITSIGGGGQTPNLATVLGAGATTGNISITSPNARAYSNINNASAAVGFTQQGGNFYVGANFGSAVVSYDDGAIQGSLQITSAGADIVHPIGSTITSNDGINIGFIGVTPAQINISANSAIIGGTGNSVANGVTNVTIIGSTAVTANYNDTVYVPALNVRGGLKDVTDVMSIDPQARKLYDTAGVEVFDWSAGVTMGTFSLPITHYVYLVESSTDATDMGGDPRRVYTTFQAAYSAADTLQQALGGSTKVVIQVGKMTNTASGDLTLSANYNSNVIINGINSSVSGIGSIIGGTFSVNITITNIGMAAIAAEGGITLIGIDSSVTALNTSSSTGATGNISVTSSRNLLIGSITSSSSLGNIGTLTFSLCNNITVSGTVTMTQTAASGNFNIGLFSLTQCDTVRFSQLVMTMASSNNTGTIAGISISAPNQNIVFGGNLRITGYVNNTNTASNVAIGQVTLFNTTFAGFFINNRTIGTNTWEGGTITSLNIQKCIFRTRGRIMYHNATTITSGANFRFTDNVIKGTSDGSGLDFYIQNTDVSFDSFVIDNCQCNLQTGFAVAHNGAAPATVPFTIDGQSINIRNVTADVFLMDIANNSGVANSVDDVIIFGCNFVNFQAGISEGDVNFMFIRMNTSAVFYFAHNGTTPTKRSVFNSCNIQNYLLQENWYNIPTTFKNTYFHGYYTVSGLTQDVIAYNSFIESSAEPASVTTWNGTLTTSTIKRLTTDDVGGLTLNNSFDEAV